MILPSTPRCLLQPRCLALFLLAVPLLGQGASTARAQAQLNLPDQSQRATVSQRIGLTDITIRYHRPLVGGRKIWGALVP